ncbi:DMT family transporter [Gilvimarinus sp. F26214L]|uniref:DMT family transporter n=1 Tax=Gilvimarinus sp. DZF01 TaxID=3461371 RepID=UPI004045F1E8
MTGRTVRSALLLLVVGNALAIGSDVVVKLMDPELPLFQFIFLRTLLSVILLLPLWRQVDFSHLQRGGKLHLLRAHITLVGIICMVTALQTLPLATANALFYAAPLLVVLFSVILFRERLTALSVLAVVSGFAGILVILRPLEFSWTGLSALGAAVALAFNAVLVRKLPSGQSPIHVLFVTTSLGLPAIGILALLEGAAWEWSLWTYAFGSAALILGYSLTVLMAYRHVEANQITSAEYTGLLWAVGIGWIWFGEVPDLWFVAGALMIVIPLLLLAWQHSRKLRRTLESID